MSSHAGSLPRPKTICGAALRCGTSTATCWGALYLSVLETLERQVTCDEAAIDDIALTIYLTVSAWQPNGAPPLQLLASLHQVIAVALAAQPFEIAPDAGAKRRYQ